MWRYASSPVVATAAIVVDLSNSGGSPLQWINTHSINHEDSETKEDSMGVGMYL